MDDLDRLFGALWRSPLPPLDHRVDRADVESGGAGYFADATTGRMGSTDERVALLRPLASFASGTGQVSGCLIVKRHGRHARRRHEGRTKRATTTGEFSLWVRYLTNHERCRPQTRWSVLWSRCSDTE